MSTRKEKAAISGVAIVELKPSMSSGGVQVTLHDITVGSGTVTITAMPGGTNEYQPVADGTVDLSDDTAPKTLLIQGSFDAIKATSSSSSDAFKLVVGGI
jgi:hypothetical protein